MSLFPPYHTQVTAVNSGLVLQQASQLIMGFLQLVPRGTTETGGATAVFLKCGLPERIWSFVYLMIYKDPMMQFWYLGFLPICLPARSTLAN